MKIHMKQYINLLRVKHYIKNLLIFMPLFFSGKVFEAGYLLKCILGIASFSLISSVVYIINDIIDVEKDRAHPVKCNRAIASGAVSIRKAIILGIGIWLVAFILHSINNGLSLDTATVVLLGYFVLNIFYSKGLKNVPIIDIFILAIGFVLRIVYGSSITGIEVSNWMYLTVITFSFYLGLGKRRNEIVKVKDSQETRSVLKHYTYDFLDKNMYMFLATTLVFYSLWAVSEDTVLRIGDGRLILTVPLVMVICMKYSLILEGNSYGDPVDVLLSDRILQFLVVIYGILVFGILYIGNMA